MWSAPDEGFPGLVVHGFARDIVTCEVDDRDRALCLRRSRRGDAPRGSREGPRADRPFVGDTQHRPRRGDIEREVAAGRSGARHRESLGQRGLVGGQRHPHGQK